MGSAYRYSSSAAITLLAALSCLQPGIDPVFLTLLSAAHPLTSNEHGWIVCATQMGMATGSLVSWRLGSRLPQPVFPLVAFVAVLASLATLWTDGTAALLGIRACYGLAMGVLYTDAMSRAAAGRPNGAYGAVFLIQLILSTLLALVLPAVASAFGAQTALAILCATPLVAMTLAMSVGRGGDRLEHAGTALVIHQRQPVDTSAWALAAATLLFICATMMVWSFTGAMAIAAGIGSGIVGEAVAIGSLAGAVTAACVMRERSLVPLPVTGLLSGLCLLAPIAATQGGHADPMVFILSVILLNIGSTAIIIRGSGAATARSEDALFRRLVTCTHSGGMILGPVIGSIAATLSGGSGLLVCAVVTITAGCLALVVAGFKSARFNLAEQRHHRAAWAPSRRITPQA